MKINTQTKNLIPYVLMGLLLTTYAIWSKNDEFKKAEELIGGLEELFTKNHVDRETILIDARTPVEYKRGHLNRAYNIPGDQIEHELPFLIINRDKEVVLYGRNSRRVSSVKKSLEEMGYVNIVNLNEKYEREGK